MATLHYSEWRRKDTRELLWIVYSQGLRIEGELCRIKQSIRKLTRMEGDIMSALDDTKQMLSDLESEVGQDIAATAADLAELKSRMMVLRDQLHVAAPKLAKAIADTSGSSSSSSGGSTDTSGTGSTDTSGSGPAP
jgi:peptidoglycan hydrolase CwlO-like protein